MGIKGLPKLINDIAGESAIRSYKFSRFKGLKTGVDASLMIHQIVIAVRGNGKDMRNNKGELTSHLYGIFYKVLSFLENDMIPIFVFDGKAPDIKNRTMEIRRERKMRASKKLETLTDSEDEEYIKNFKQTYSITKENMEEAHKLLDLMGIPYIIAPEEADVVLAWLAARCDSDGKRYVKGVCSDDSDILALGASYLFKDMLKNMGKNKPITVISLKRTLVKMNLTMNQFINLCSLLGTDYCESIRGIGPKTAYKLIRKYSTIEKILKSIHQDDSDSSDGSSGDEEKSNEKCLIATRDYYKYALKNLDESDTFVLTDDQLELRKFQYDELIDFMCVKHGFDFTRIQTGVNRLKRCYKILDVTRKNTKKVHTIIQPRSENYIFRALTDDFDFISSDEEDTSSNKNKKLKK